MIIPPGSAITPETLSSFGFSAEDLHALETRSAELHDPILRSRLEETLSPLVATTRAERVKAFRVQASFRDFVREFWPIVEPAVGYIEGPHMVAIIDHMQAVADDHIKRLLVNVPPGSAKPCASSGFVLEKTRGRVRLGEITVDDQVLTHRGRFRRVVAVHEQGILPTLSITTHTGRVLRLAPDHTVLTARGWIQAKDLLLTDVLAEVHATEPSGTETIPPEEARLLGYLIGDGCVKYNSPIFTNQDPEAIADFVHCAEVCGFTTRVSPRGKTFAISLKSAPGEMHRRHKNDAGPVRMWLRKHGIEGADSYTKRVPALVMAGTQKLIAEYLGAYWACDGHVEKRDGRINQCSIGADTVSFGLVKDTQHLLNRLGIQARVRTKRAKLASVRQPGGIYTSYCVIVSCIDHGSKFAEKVPVRHAKAALLRRYHRTGFDRVLNEDAIVSIESAEPTECRCLTVEEDSSFAFEDLAVHNSLLIAVMFPAWMWLRNPGWRVLCGSYNQDLSNRDSQRSRDVIRSKEYEDVKQALGQTWQIAADQDLKQYYMNTAKGFRVALAVGGKATGFRGDCVTGETLVPTADGPKRIDSIAVGEEVLSFNHETGEQEPARVVAVRRIKGRLVGTFTTVGRKTLRCTPEHRVFIDDMGLGYMKAEELVAGDLLLGCAGNDEVAAPFALTGEKADVYDLQVERNSNFFANNILIHNCLIFDDLVNVKDPDKITRESLAEARSWWNVTMSSRLNNLATGTKIGIMQRVSEFDPCEDLIRRKLPDGTYEYDLLALPSEYDPDLYKALGRPDSAGTSIGWTDWRTSPGELLFPELFPQSVIEQAKVDLGSLMYAANHGQRPTPSTGGFFQRHWWRFWVPEGKEFPPPIVCVKPDGTSHACEQIRLPSLTGMLISADLTFKDSVGSDFVALQAWGYGTGEYRSSRFLVDQVVKRMDFVQTLRAFREFCERWPQAGTKLIEDKANGPAVIASLKAEMSGIIAVDPQGDKQGRANAVSPQIESGHVYLPHPAYFPWVNDLLLQAHSFPKGLNDDMVDCLTQALARKRTIVV